MSQVSLNTQLNTVVTTYLQYCEIEKNLSQNTIKMYHFYLNDFNEWMKQKLKKDEITLKDINYEVVRDYRINLNRRVSSKSGHEFKRSTQKTFLVALRAFLKYLVIENDVEVLSPEKVILGKPEARVVKVLNEDQLERLFGTQDLSKRSGVRDRAILELLFSTGLRVSELVSLNIDSVNLKSGEFTVVGKGRKVRTVYLSNSALILD